MATAWRRWRVRRQLRGLLAPGEDPLLIERLHLGGWWVMTEQALYVLGRDGDPTRLPLSTIRTVLVKAGSATSLVSVIPIEGNGVVGDLPPNSPLVARLQELELPPSVGPS